MRPLPPTVAPIAVPTLLALLVAIPACIAPVSEPASGDDQPSFGQSESALSSSQRRTRAGQIRDAALAAGITEGYLLAGIADAETSMAHCHSELTWACRGPYSADCGGPVVAGAGDGPCSLRQGGLGMFQFDAGTYEQTLAREGSRVLSIAGNVQAGVDFVVNMVIRSAYVPGVEDRAQAIAWINGVRLDNARFDPWIRTVTHYYNGCRPGYSCFSSRYARYRDHTRNVHGEMGASFWGAPVCEASCVDRTRIRDASCGVGDCGAYGATCVDDDLGARCVSAFCEARGESQACLDDDQLLSCRNGAHVGVGSCGAFGATCVDDELGARCVSVFCEPVGASSSCFPDSNILLTCRDGGIVDNGDCGARGATCVDDELGARCVSPFCPASGVSDSCVPGEVRITCEDGGVVDREECAVDGGVCVDDGEVARCVTCPASGRSHRCAGEAAVERCDDGVLTIDECAEGTMCREDGGEAACQGAAEGGPGSPATLPGVTSPGPGGGEGAGGPPPGGDAARGHLVSGGCSAPGLPQSPRPWPLALCLGAALARHGSRRRRRRRRGAGPRDHRGAPAGACSRGRRRI